VGRYETAFLVSACGPIVGVVVLWFALRTTPNVVHSTARRRPPFATARYFCETGRDALMFRQDPVSALGVTPARGG